MTANIYLALTTVAKYSWIIGMHVEWILFHNRVTTLQIVYGQGRHTYLDGHTHQVPTNEYRRSTTVLR